MTMRPTVTPDSVAADLTDLAIRARLAADRLAMLGHQGDVADVRGAAALLATIACRLLDNDLSPMAQAANSPGAL